MVSNWGDFSLSPTPAYTAMSGVIFGCQNLGGVYQAAGVWRAEPSGRLGILQSQDSTFLPDEDYLALRATGVKVEKP